MNETGPDETTLRDVVAAIDTLRERVESVLDQMDGLKIEIMTVREAIEASREGGALGFPALKRDPAAGDGSKMAG